MTEETRRQCPYVGLVPYLEDDWEFFVGREIETDLIIANFKASRLTLLYGASGVGKSSLLRAGVAHRLGNEARENKMAWGSPELAVVVFSNWRDDPVAGLSQSIQDAVATATGKDPGAFSGPGGLAEAFAHWASLAGGGLFLILDQFEEYFLYHDREDGEGSFAVEFPRWVNLEGLRVNILLSIRDDAVARLDRFKGRIPRLFDNYLRLHHLGWDAAKQAIRKPLDRFNRRYPEDAVTIEEDLVDEVLRQTQSGRVTVGQTGAGVVDATDNSSAIQVETPYLQMVLTRLWAEERAAGSRELRLDTFTDPNKLGGAEQIVRTHLDSEMAKLAPEERDVAATVFRYLVTRSGTKIALAADDLVGFTDLPVDVITGVLEQLSGGERRILRPLPVPDQPRLTRYEIFHDVLGPAVADWRWRREAQRGVEKQRKLDRTRYLKIGVMLVAFTMVVLASTAHYALQQRDLAQGQAALAKERLKRMTAGQEARIAFLSGNEALYQDLQQRGLINTTLKFGVTKKSSGVPSKHLYEYKLFPVSETVPGGLTSLALVTFKLNHSSFRNSLLAAGPDRSFVATYVGWGCMQPVLVLVDYADPDKPPDIASFDMCAAIR